MQIGDLSGINWVSEVNSKVICQIFCLIKGSVASRCNVVIRKLLVQYLQAFLFFYCFAFLNTSKLLLIFNFFWEEESTMRSFHVVFARKYTVPICFLLVFLDFFLLFPWCWMHVYKKKRHLWSMDSSGDMYFLNSVSFCQTICNSVFYGRGSTGNLDFCMITHRKLHSSLFQRARFSLRNCILYRPENHSYKEKAECEWKSLKRKEFFGGGLRFCETHF